MTAGDGQLLKSMRGSAQASAKHKANNKQFNAEAMIPFGRLIVFLGCTLFYRLLAASCCHDG